MGLVEHKPYDWHQQNAQVDQRVLVEKDVAQQWNIPEDREIRVSLLVSDMEFLLRQALIDYGKYIAENEVAKLAVKV